MTKLIVPQWSAHRRVQAFSTTRVGGVSLAPWNSLNLGAHCGDNAHHVVENRQRLYAAARLPNAPVWLEQVHGKTVLHLTGQILEHNCADASYTDLSKIVCTVMTADCLPVLFCNLSGTKVAAAHAGWRGLCKGVLEQTVHSFREQPKNIMAWLGPAIGPTAFEVGNDVRDAFIAQDSQAIGAFLPLKAPDKFLANIYLLARQRLANCGVNLISGGEHCTYSESDDFFSYRRDKTTGRMASLIWLT